MTFPLDLTKTRLQIQGESAVPLCGQATKRTNPYRGMLRTAAGIIQEEGVLKLWQGATPAVYRQIGLICALKDYCIDVIWVYISLNQV